MRALGLVLLLLLAPVAAADTTLPLVTIAAEEPPMVRPLQGAVTTNFTVRVSCALMDGARGIPLEYAVVESPPWSTVLVSPASDIAEATGCEAGYVTRQGVVSITASDEAPAFRATPVTVSVVAGPDGRRQEARAQVNLTADYFAILDVQARETQKVAPPDARLVFVVNVHNLGNANTRVTFTVENVTGGLVVQPPTPITLQSRQQGGIATAQEVPVTVFTRSGGVFVNEVGTITLRVESEHAGEPARPGDGSTVTMLVTTRTGGNDAPLPVLATLAALALASLGKRRLRG